MSKLLEWFLLFFRTMASSHAEDRRLTKDGGEVRIQALYALLRAMRGSNEMTHPRTEELAGHPSTRTFATIVGRFFCASCAAIVDACPARLFPSKPCKIRDPDLMRNLSPGHAEFETGHRVALPPFSEESSLRDDPILCHLDLVHTAKREEELHLVRGWVLRNLADNSTHCVGNRGAWKTTEPTRMPARFTRTP